MGVECHRASTLCLVAITVAMAQLIGEPMSDGTFDAEAYVDAAAALIELPIAAEHRTGVIVNLERIAQMAALVMAFPLPDDAEPAPVYRP